MTLSDLERLAREVVAYDEWSDLAAEYYRAGRSPNETPPAPPQPMMDEHGDAFETATELARGCLALLQLARAVQDWSKIRHRGAADDDRLYQALAALDLKDET